MAKVTGPLFSMEAWGTLGDAITYRRPNFKTTTAQKNSPHTHSTLDNNTIVISTPKASAKKRSNRQVLWSNLYAEAGRAMRLTPKEDEIKLCAYLLAAKEINYNPTQILRSPAQKGWGTVASKQFKCLLESHDDLRDQTSAGLGDWFDSHFNLDWLDHAWDWIDDLATFGAGLVGITNFWKWPDPVWVFNQEFGPGEYEGVIDLTQWFGDPPKTLFISFGGMASDAQIDWYVKGTRTATASPLLIGSYLHHHQAWPPGYYEPGGCVVYLKPKRMPFEDASINSSRSFIRDPARPPYQLPGYYYQVSVPEGTHIHVYLSFQKILL